MTMRSSCSSFLQCIHDQRLRDARNMHIICIRKVLIDFVLEQQEQLRHDEEIRHAQEEERQRRLNLLTEEEAQY
ncbi:unnamed protein product [Rotaria sp. Silwood2]|nr:unnamed protein product [Rotaria sp. Silwood2]CAF4479420.1 unnamed protein product [Rotaria sp. Silwood2]